MRSCTETDPIARRGARIFGGELQSQQFGDIARSGAAHDIRAVHLDGARAEVEPPRDRLVAEPGGDRIQNVALARGQRRQPRFGLTVPRERALRRVPVGKRRVDRAPDEAEVERRGQQILRAAAQDRARFGDTEPLGSDEGEDRGAPRDPFEQRRAVGSSRLAPAKKQHAGQIVALGLDPRVGARKAANDPRMTCGKRAETGRPFDRVGQDQMDMAPAFGHAAMLRAERSGRQRERIGGGAISARFRISRPAFRILVTPTGIEPVFQP